MRILVVDDSADAARMMQVLLEIDGHDVAVALDGGEALEKARAFLPDVLLLDLILPDMSGAEVAEGLRGTAGFEAAAIIAVSGYGADAVPSAFDGHFTKPVDHDALSRCLAKLASDRSARTPSPPSPRPF